MNKKFIALFFILITLCTYSQKVYVNMGKNYTTYKFVNTQEASSRTSEDGGNFYELGYLSRRKKDSVRLSYELGLSLNEFNSIVKAPEDAVRYQTQYLGLKMGLDYRIIGGYYRNRFMVYLKGGVTANRFLSGKEDIYDKIYDLKTFDEFNKSIFMGYLGLHTSLIISEDLSLDIGYNRSESFLNTGNTSNQRLSFSANQFNVGLIFSVN